jgi:ComF family protein
MWTAARRTRPNGTEERAGGGRCRIRAALGAIRGAADGVLAVVFAPRCAACGYLLDAPTRGPVCEACWASLRPLAPPLCERCGDQIPSWRTTGLAGGLCGRCGRRPHLVARCRAFGPYEGQLRLIIHALKYDKRRSLARRLALLMRQSGADVLAGADCLVPVPLHWRRLRTRGFNQAADLAAGLGLPVARALRRVRPTPPQAGLSARGRHRNLRGAFAPARRSGHRRAVAGKCVVLVDDVLTTGATLDNCACALKAAGAREVRALTVARAVSRPR